MSSDLTIRTRPLWALLLAGLVSALLLPAIFAGSASGQPRGGLTIVPEPKPPTRTIKGVMTLAERELRRNVTERKGNNVPRYNRGKGQIAPYSIRDAWCVAFATWVWAKNGFTDYLGTRLLRVGYGGDILAIQVRDMTRWAKQNGYFSTRAKPGYMVVYGGNHMGIVTRADRKGRAVKSIEGNKTDSVSRVTIEMEDVTGYISPTPLTFKQRSAIRSLRPDL